MADNCDRDVEVSRLLDTSIVLGEALENLTDAADYLRESERTGWTRRVDKLVHDCQEIMAEIQEDIGDA